jgi:hypothetical protein
MNPLFLEALGRLETAGGLKTIKGPNGEDSHNLFNIKDFGGSGYQAFDKAEGSNDKYRAYPNHEASKADAMDMIRRLYPKAFEATTAEEFADGLLNGVEGRKYATDPAYRDKMIATVRSLEKNTAAGKPPTPVQAVKLAPLPATASRGDPDLSRSTEDAQREAGRRGWVDQAIAADAVFKDDPRAQYYGLVDRAVDLATGSERDDPNWKYNPADYTKGMSVKEQEYLAAAVPGGKSAVDRRAAEIVENRSRDQALSGIDFWPSMVGNLTSQRNNIPGALVNLATLGVGMVARTGLAAKAAGEAAGVAQQGSLATRTAIALSPAQRLAAAGRPTAAVAAAVAEGAVVDTALLAASDIGGRQNYSFGEYTENVVTGVVLNALPELVTLPSSLKDARAKRLADSMPTLHDEVSADAILNVQRAAREVADDTAKQVGPVTDAEASRMNAGELPEPVAPRLGGSTRLGQILRDWDDADESVALTADLTPAKASEAPDRGYVSTSQGDTVVSEMRAQFAADKDLTVRPDRQEHDGHLSALVNAAQMGDEQGFVKARNTLKAMLSTGKVKGDEARMVTAIVNRGQSVIGEHKKPGVLLKDENGNATIRMSTTFEKGAITAQDSQRALNNGKVVPVQTIDTGTAREALDAILDNEHVISKGLTGPVRHMLAKLPPSILDGLRVSTRDMRLTAEAGVYHGSTNTVAIGVSRSGVSPKTQLGFKETLRGLSDSHEAEAVVHEIVHGVASQVLDIVADIRSGAYFKVGRANPEVPQEWHDLYDHTTDLFERFKVAAAGSKDQPVQYAALNVHEFLSQAISNYETRAILAKMPATPAGGGRWQNAWQEFKARVIKFLTAGQRGTALEEATVILDRLMDTRSKTNIVDNRGNPLPTAKDFPAWSGGKMHADVAPVGEEFLAADLMLPPSFSSMTSGQARKFSDEVRKEAEQALAQNPIDKRKLDVLAGMAPERMGALTTGLTLARSKNPILQRMAQLITETTTGAAGRQATVAVRRDSVATMLYGDSAQAYTTIADRWAKASGHGIRDRWFSGDSRREFDRQVYLYKRELDAAQKHGKAAMAAVQGHPLVKEAASHLHQLYQRSADMKRAAGTIGSDKLPKSSLGYVPQELDGKKLRALQDPAIHDAIRTTLAQHWVKENGWDEAFSLKIARLYMDRAKNRAGGGQAYGGKMVDSQGIGDVRTVVKDAVGDGYVTSAEAEAAMGRLQDNDKRGGRETRERLNVPMTAKIGDGLMMDYFVTDQLSMAHRHVQNAAGEIALTEMGIPGAAGLERMRLAADNSVPAPTLAEMRAFDQVAAELFGRAPEGAVYSELAQTTRLMTSVLKLGGAAFNQLAETNNLIHSLGLAAAMKQIATLPNEMLKVRRRANGEVMPPGLLDSIETWGGEIGMSDYRINFPLRATDEALREYSEAPGLLASLVKAGAMAQHKISFFRGIHAAQHRATAEQILLKSARMIRDWDGVSDMPKHLADMGFDKELVGAFKTQFDKVAVYDDAGRLMKFDVQAVGNPHATEAFVQAIHRGTRQIIQGTFIGERNAWVHNDWIGLMTQFRTFSITAMEKQWARNRFMQDNKYVGYAYLAGIVGMQAAFAAPIYWARMQSQAMLMDEKERQEFLDKRMNLPELTRGIMNYAGASGLTGDLLEYAMMFGGKTAGLEGARGAGQADVMGTVVPAAGAVNQGARALGGAVEAALDDKEDNVKVDRVLKTLPFSSIWWVTPFINAARE